MSIHHTRLCWLLTGAALVATAAYPCSVAGEISNLAMVKEADAIVRAAATEYATPPSDPQSWTTGVPDSRVRFRVIENIRGPAMSSVILPGYLGRQDDFNDQQPPYTFVRPGGRAGSCFANTYRSGAQFLLMLKKEKGGELTVNWYALAPVNEQLHSDNDPWLVWVREHAHQGDGATGSENKPAAKK